MRTSLEANPVAELTDLIDLHDNTCAIVWLTLLSTAIAIMVKGARFDVTDSQP